MRTLLVIGLSWAIGLALTAHARNEPEPRPASALAQEFSQARARRIQQQLVGDGTPRAIGSAANLAAVQRISTQLTQLGLQPALQQRLACAQSRCGNITNLVARVEGRQPGSVLLVAHHDSVEASPGASDDAAGVAVLLETARALLAGPSLRHGVILLISDGEEVGSLGATAFATDHPWMRDVAAVINVDNGGTSGLSLLYGTGVGNLGVVDTYARVVPHPASSSVLAIGHAYLPRASDFSVFAARGLPGLDLAFAGDEALYHTALDTVERTHPGSLQHEGDCVLALTRALAAGDLQHLVSVDAAWFDLFGRWVVRWPAVWSLPLALVALGLLAMTMRRLRMPPMAAASALAAALLATLASGLLAVVTQLVLRRLALIPADYIRAPYWLVLAMLGVGVLCVVAVSGRLVRVEPAALELGVWCTWTLGAVTTALVLPGASVLFLPTALTASVARVLLGHSRYAATLTSAAAAIALAAAWFPAWALAPDTFGLSALVVFAAPAAWIGSLLLPGLASLSARQRRWLMLTTSSVVLVGLGGHALARKFDAASPQRVNVIAYTDATARRSVAIVDTTWGSARAAAPAPMRAALAKLASRTPEDSAPFAWSSTPMLFASLAELTQPTPAITVHVEASHSDATTLRVQLAPSVRRLLVLANEPAPIASLRIGTRRWPSVLRPGRHGSRYRTWGLYAPAADSMLKLEWDSAQHAATELTFVADMPELPDSFRALLDSRPSWAVASQSGDHSVVSLRLRP